MLHGVHLFTHVENDFDTGEVHAEVSRQRKNNFEAFDICVGVKSSVAFGARWLEQALSLVQSQGLRMYFELRRDGADRKCASLAFHNYKGERLRLSPFSFYSSPISTLGFSGLSVAYRFKSSLVSSEITVGKVTFTSTN